jgi:hypothetical protein
VADKIEMMSKIRNIIESRGGGPSNGPDGGLGKRSLSDGSLVSFQSKKRQEKIVYVFLFCFEGLSGCFVTIFFLGNIPVCFLVFLTASISWHDYLIPLCAFSKCTHQY